MIYQLPFFYLHYRENYFNSLQAFIGLESFWIDYTWEWNHRAMICMFLKFLALCFIHMQGILFSSDDYSLHRHNLSKKSISRKKAWCMAYLHNNAKIKKQKYIQFIKKEMKGKLDLVQQQLGGAKFEQIAGGGFNLGGTSQASRRKSKDVYEMNDEDYSISSDHGLAAAPFLRRGVSSYDPDVVRKEEKELQQKRQYLEDMRKDMEMFEVFTEAEKNELSKLDFLTRTYLFLRRHITNPIIACDEGDIKYAVKDFAAGSLHCQSRIERIGKKSVTTITEKKVLKTLTETKAMIVNIFSTFIYCLISHTSNLAYIFMFLNCMCTGNLISLFYPLSVLLYALMEDPRPRSKYWSMILIYAELVILFKFLIQQNALTVLTPGSLFVEIVDKFKLGFRVFDKKEYAKGIFGFIIWDILVALSVLLHQHCLVLLGLWKKRECDFETIEDAERRLKPHLDKFHFEISLKKSPERTFRMQNLDQSNTSEREEFKFSIQQLDASPIEEEEEKEEEPERRMDTLKVMDFKREKSAKLPAPTRFGSLDDMDIINNRVRRITDIDIHDNISDNISMTEDNIRHYEPDYFIHEYSENTEEGNVVSCNGRIVLDNDENYSFIDLGHRNMSEQDIKYYEGIDDENILGMQNALIIDYHQENPDEFKLRNRVTFRKLVIENDFLLRIFPIVKKDKPGIDLYNYGVVFQFLIVVYILFFFNQMTGEKEDISETFKFKRFRTEMIFFMFIQIMLILLDRFFYISNTFDQLESEQQKREQPKSVIHNVMKSENRHNFIKLMVYLALVVLVHMCVIWYFPITGNYKISEQIF